MGDIGARAVTARRPSPTGVACVGLALDAGRAAYIKAFTAWQLEDLKMY